VPGGKWQTVISSPACCANRASFAFHARARYPLEPPASQVTSSRVYELAESTGRLDHFSFGSTRMR
jgi:hypothetical protein